MSALRYTVRRNNWQPGASGELVRLPGDDFVAGFGNLPLTERLRDRLERNAVAGIANPFRAVPKLADLTSLPAFALADWLQDVGLAPPSARADGSRNWAAWWDDRRKFWPDGHVAHLFAGLDRLRFFTLTERPSDRTAFVAVEPLWGYAPEVVRDLDPFPDVPGDYTATPDGGRPVRAFRRAADAAAFVDLAAEPGQRRWDGLGYQKSVPRRWLEVPHTVADWHALKLVRWDQVPPYRVHEVEFDDTDGPPAGTAYLVCRNGWRPGHRPRVRADEDHRLQRRRVPVAVCTRAEAADRRAAELSAEVYADRTPFDFEGSIQNRQLLERRLRGAGLLDGDSPERLFPLVSYFDSRDELRDWWNDHAGNWSADRRASVWRTVGPPLYDVIPVPFEE